MDLARENARLREQLEIKDAEIAELRSLIADDEISFPSEWKLTRIQCRILRFLLKQPGASRGKVHAFLYGDRDDGGPELENVRVHMCLLRKKLQPHRLTIGWSQQRGYFLRDEAKQKIANSLR